MAVNQKYSFKDAMRGYLILSTRGAVKLFDVSASVVTMLENKDITALMTGFSNNGYPLSGTVHVKRKTPQIWIVRDDIRTYLLWLGANRLNVFTRAGEFFNAGIIPQDIKDEFAAIGITVPPTTVVTTRKEDRQWIFTAGTRRIFCHYDKEMVDNVRDARYNFYKANYKDETDFAPGDEIVGTCFYQESALGDTGDPAVSIFPDTMNGVVFRRCNLDNVYVPPGNTVVMTGWEKCSRRRIRVQNDLEDWIVDASGNPIEPVNVQVYIDLGLSIDPADIPAEPLDEPITITAR